MRTNPAQIEPKGFLERLYYAGTSFLDTSLLGLFVGLSSGIAINVATSENLKGFFFWSIIFNVFAVVCLVVLIRIRQKIERAVANRSDYQTPPLEKWQQSADWKDKPRVRLFFTFLLAVILFFFTGVAFIIVANSKLKKEDEQEAFQIRQRNKQELFELDSIKKELSMIYDSVQNLSAKRIKGVEVLRRSNGLKPNH